LILYHSPELTNALVDFINKYWIDSVCSRTATAIFDVYGDSMFSKISSLLDYMCMIIIYMWGVVGVVHTFHTFGWDNATEIYLNRLYYYLFGISRMTRIQYESILTTLFFVVFYISMMIATFDDDQEEFLEIFNGMCFYLFSFLLVYFLYKYSIHYFAFLEASVNEGKGLNFAYTQFAKDALNTFAFVLRFFVLILRLNIYDSLDDFYDSYYIFVGDFDDDEYFVDFFGSLMSVMFFDSDVNDDRAFLLEDELDVIFNPLTLYFIVWGKLSLFMFFIVEELLRVGLALYITYMIIFEVHAVNRSYVEDTYFSTSKIISNIKVIKPDNL